MDKTIVLTEAIRLFDLAESQESESRDRSYRAAHELVYSLLSGTTWSSDAPDSALLRSDGALISTCVAIQYARCIRREHDKHFFVAARLHLLALLGDEAADENREVLEHNASIVARLELGLHPTSERWL